MAARILPFRSLVPLEKAVGFTPVAGRVRAANGPATVVTMRRQARHGAPVDPAAVAMRAKVEGEMAEGYVEVEVAGMSWRRLTCVYRVLLRAVWMSATGSVRSLLGLAPTV